MGTNNAPGGSAVASKMKLEQEPFTDGISLRCTEHLLGIIAKFLQYGRDRARAVFLRRRGSCIYTGGL